MAIGATAHRLGLGVCAAVALLAGGVVADNRLHAEERPTVRPLLGRTLNARADLVETARGRGFGAWSAAARVTTGPLRGARVALRGPAHVRRPAGEVGEELELRGEVAALAPWEGYEAVRGARGAIVVDAARLTRRRRGGLAGAVDAARRRAERALEPGLPRSQAVLARGMV